MNEVLRGLLEAIDPSTLKVHVPTKVVFLCGGAIDSSEVPSEPKMLRDAYYRFRKADASSLPFKIVLAEDADPLTADAGYEDLLSFESDLAQIVGLIVLFVESAGSFAELGAFSALETIAPNLLAVILDRYYEHRSFIKNGPIKYLENRHGEDSILSIDTRLVGIEDPSKVSGVNAERLSEQIEAAIEARLSRLKKWRSFDPKSNGHKILVMTGLCQEYGALTQTEIKLLMEVLGIEIDPAQIKSFIYCAELMKWLKLVRKGHVKYVVALQGSGQEKALDWSFSGQAAFKDRLRWRANIRAGWRAADPLRHRAISEASDE